MEANQILRLLGDPGKHAWLVFVLSSINYFPVAFNHLIMSIYGARPPHRCSLPEGRWVNTSIPLLDNGEPDSCHVWDSSVSNKTVPCPQGWDYTLLDGESTIVNEWDLVCDRKHLTWTATSIYFAGVMIGGLIFGTISDKVGRLPVLAFTLFMSVILGMVLFFVESFILFVIIRCAIGILMQGLQNASYVLGVELFYSSKHRAITAALFETCWGLGVMTLSCIAYALRKWRWIQLGITLPTLLSFTYIWYFPESTRWLIAKKKYEKAIENIKRSANFNNIALPDDLINTTFKEKNETEDKNTTKHSIFDLFKTSKLRMRTFVMFYAWLATTLGYYGLSMNAASLGGNKYLNFFINGAIEIPAYLSGIFMLPKLGRKKTLIFYFLLGGTSCIAAAFVPEETTDGSDIQWVTILLAWVGKFSGAGCLLVIYLYASEIFPTVIRNIGVGTCAFWARFGCLIAPQVISLGDYTEKWVPFVILGSVSVLAGLLTILLPETKGRKLPDTIEEAENMLEDGYGEEDTAHTTDVNGDVNFSFTPENNKSDDGILANPKSTQL